MAIPLIVLAAACLFGGLLQWPSAASGQPLFFRFLRSTFAGSSASGPVRAESILTAISVAVSLLGAGLAWVLFAHRSAAASRLAGTSAGAAIHRLWFAGWGFDWVYDKLLVQPFVRLARANNLVTLYRVLGGGLN